MKLTVVFDRYFDNYELLEQIIEDYNFSSLSTPGYCSIPLLKYSERNNKLLDVYFLDDSDEAIVKRNRKIISETDKLLCFWSGVCLETKNFIDLAIELGKEYRIVFI